MPVLNAEQDRDADALYMSQLHAEHARPLMYFLLGLTGGDRFVAEDILQETMLRAWRHLDSLPTSHRELRRWFLTAARHTAVDIYHRRQRGPQEVLFEDVTVPVAGDEPEESVLLAVVVRGALDSLSPEQRAVMADLYVHGCSLRQAAAFHGIPVGTVKSRAHHAVQALKRAVDGVSDDRRRRPSWKKV